ncbi:EamA family transporter [Candidatus Falkowbacteria bacterium]|jgi:drug/metabolite transporter (DMT)-like permease|nr:EamA family transporter [Candidatus Falkowbacteria bacterium]
MSWVLVALLAYFLLAIANLFDKFLVDNVLPSGKAYAFAACLLGGLLVLGAPWFLEWPGFYWFVINLLTGAVFAVALWLLYEAFRRGDASQTAVLVGGLTPIFSIFFSIVFFKEQYSSQEWIGIITLLVGIFIIALLPQKRHIFSRILSKLGIKQKTRKGFFLFALGSALAYAIYFVATKYAYSAQPFASVFIWNRLGATLLVLTFLIKRRDRKQMLAVFKKSNKRKGKRKYLVLLSQALGSGGFLLQSYAIFLGSVALVNALQGVQYAFLLIISTILAAIKPKLLKETFSARIFTQKLVAVIVIGFGLYFIMI